MLFRSLTYAGKSLSYADLHQRISAFAAEIGRELAQALRRVRFGAQAVHVVVERDEYTEKLSASLDKFLIDYKAACDVAFHKLKLP